VRALWRKPHHRHGGRNASASEVCELRC
jgi:hypothetical protein